MVNQSLDKLDWTKDCGSKSRLARLDKRLANQSLDRLDWTKGL
ncbi:MAG: hypothetical protein ACRC3B_08965 [Bacteroidia bacterium]